MAPSVGSIGHHMNCRAIVHATAPPGMALSRDALARSSGSPVRDSRPREIAPREDSAVSAASGESFMNRIPGRSTWRAAKGRPISSLEDARRAMAIEQKITPFLWFDNNAEEAVNFYISLF